MGDGLDGLAERALAFWRAGSGEAAETAEAEAEVETAAATAAAEAAARADLAEQPAVRRDAIEQLLRNDLAEALEFYAARSAQLVRNAAGLEAAEEASRLRVAALQKAPSNPVLAQGKRCEDPTLRGARW